MNLVAPLCLEGHTQESETCESCHVICDTLIGGKECSGGRHTRTCRSSPSNTYTTAASHCDTECTTTALPPKDIEKVYFDPALPHTLDNCPCMKTDSMDMNICPARSTAAILIITQDQQNPGALSTKVRDASTRGILHS